MSSSQLLGRACTQLDLRFSIFVYMFNSPNYVPLHKIHAALYLFVCHHNEYEKKKKNLTAIALITKHYAHTSEI